jgi:hypothetical protein
MKNDSSPPKSLTRRLGDREPQQQRTGAPPTPGRLFLPREVHEGEAGEPDRDRTARKENCPASREPRSRSSTRRRGGAWRAPSQGWERTRVERIARGIEDLGRHLVVFYSHIVAPFGKQGQPARRAVGSGKLGGVRCRGAGVAPGNAVVASRHATVAGGKTVAAYRRAVTAPLQSVTACTGAVTALWLSVDVGSAAVTA